MTPVGFETTMPANEWPQANALDRAATGIGNISYYTDTVYYNIAAVNVGHVGFSKFVQNRILKSLPLHGSHYTI